MLPLPHGQAYYYYRTLFYYYRMRCYLFYARGVIIYYFILWARLYGDVELVNIKQ